MGIKVDYIWSEMGIKVDYNWQIFYCKKYEIFSEQNVVTILR